MAPSGRKLGEIQCTDDSEILADRREQRSSGGNITPGKGRLVRSVADRVLMCLVHAVTLVRWLTIGNQRESRQKAEAFHRR